MAIDNILLFLGRGSQGPLSSFSLTPLSLSFSSPHALSHSLLSLILRDIPLGFVFRPSINQLNGIPFLLSTCTNNLGSFRHNTLFKQHEKDSRSRVDTPWFSSILSIPPKSLFSISLPISICFLFIFFPYFVLQPLSSLYQGNVGVFVGLER